MNSKKRGKLKIFLGMAAGVGKTYAMLQEARALQAEGQDVVLGYVEPHGRVETEGLCEGMTFVPLKEVSHQGIVKKVFDLQSTLEKNPHTVIVDELAHSNLPGALHPKRWQDIYDLLNAGINVFTTCNIQHLESISESIASITGVPVKETVPDKVLHEADTIEVVDIAPEELLERLKAGKIYSKEKINSALAHFFKEGNLLALREMLLRKAAERIDSDVIEYRQKTAAKKVWETSERVIVAIGPNPFASKLIKKASKIALSRKCPLTVVYVERPHLGGITLVQQKLVDEALEIAQRLRATVERRSGTDIVKEILEVANATNASLIIIGKPIKSALKALFLPALADDLIKRSGDIDVLLVTGDESYATKQEKNYEINFPKPGELVLTVIIVALVSYLAWIVDPYTEITSQAMIYILGAIFVAKLFGRTEGVLYAVLSVLALNFLFIPPKYTFAVDNPEYLITFFVMIAVTLSISTLMIQVRLQNALVSKREKRAQKLYEAGRKINEATNLELIAKALSDGVNSITEGESATMISVAGKLKVLSSSQSNFEMRGQEFTVARLALEKRNPAGFLTDTLPGSEGMYLPIQTERRCYGVIGIIFGFDVKFLECSTAIELLLNQTATCIERFEFEALSIESKTKAETEAARTVLLSSISHDIKTPLTVIIGAAQAIKANKEKAKIPEFAELIVEHGERLTALINNILSITRFEHGGVTLHLEYESLEEIIGTVLQKFSSALALRRVSFDIGEEIPLVKVDARLLDQVFTNIIENSIKHAASATELNIKLSASDNFVEVVISDDGKGLPSKALEKVSYSDTTKHSGLGLRICQEILKLHNAELFMKNRDTVGGVECVIKVPR